MAQYLLNVYQPDGTPPPSIDLPKIMQEVGALKEKMKAEGAWVFNAGLHPPSTATVVRERDGDVLTTDGPFAEGKEHVGGLTVVEAPDLDGALRWAGEITRITSLPVEVRPIVDESAGR